MAATSSDTEIVTHLTVTQFTPFYQLGQKLCSKSVLTYFARLQAPLSGNLFIQCRGFRYWGLSLILTESFDGKSSIHIAQLKHWDLGHLLWGQQRRGWACLGVAESMGVRWEEAWVEGGYNIARDCFGWYEMKKRWWCCVSRSCRVLFCAKSEKLLL